MNPPPAWEDIERLYHEALELPVCERKALLASASPALREEVESLLEADSNSELLAAPPTHLAADLLDGRAGGLVAGERVANYEVESLISVGGMGEVYLARDAAGRPVALKILRRHLIVNAQAVDRFEREARAASALCHPNIVTVYESGKSRGRIVHRDGVDGRFYISDHPGRGPGVDRAGDGLGWASGASFVRGARSGNPASRYQAGEHHAA